MLFMQNITIGQKIIINELCKALKMEVPSACDFMTCDNARIFISELYDKIGSCNRFPPRDLKLLKHKIKYISILNK